MKYINLLFIHISYIFFQIAMFLKIGVCVCIYIYIYIYIYINQGSRSSPLLMFVCFLFLSNPLVTNW